MTASSEKSGRISTADKGRPAPSKTKLGRGLSALMAEDSAAEMRQGVRELPIEMLHPNPFQPRTRFDDKTIAELAESIRDHGIMQPILVRPMKGRNGEYEIIAGERRWRAAQKAQQHRIPVVVRTIDDTEALELALIENVQREDLSPIEEARGYQRLADEFGHTQAKIAKVVGKSRPHIANLVRLLALPPAVQEMLADGKLTMGHARALITSDSPLALARMIVAQGLSVREAETLAGGATKGVASGKKRKKSVKDADTRALEEAVSLALGLAVRIDHGGARGGSVTIKYKTLDQLDGLIDRLKK